jgi:nucleotide-binding universal stress UspA family protein
MPRISRILVPVDFSERCFKMIPYVRSFAEKYQAEVILLHILNPFYTIPETGVSGAISVPIPERVFTHAARQLDEFAVAELEGVSVRRLLYEGAPETQIAATVEAEDVQLVMMPTRGHGVFRTFLLGSITSKVLDDVARPVLTGAHGNGHSSAAVSTVVCAVDMGAQTNDVLAWAAGFAEDFRAKLAVVHVLPKLRIEGESPVGDVQPQLEELVKTAIAQFDPALARAVTVDMEEGDPPQAVSSFVRSAGADLLVIGRGSHPGRLRANAYALIRQSPCPVLSL